MRNGFGVLKQSDQRYYGEFKNGLKNGMGLLLENKTGDVYCGHFLKDNRDGD